MASLYLFSFSHDRKGDQREQNNRLFDWVERVASSTEMSFLFQRLEKVYGISHSVLSKTTKKKIVSFYSYQRAKFSPRLKLSFLLIDFCLHLAKLCYLVFFSEQKRLKKTSYHVIIDDVKSAVEVDRFRQLSALFGSGNVAVVTTDCSFEDSSFPGTFYSFPYHKNYDRRVCWKILRSELAFGIWITFLYSLKCRLNLFPVMSSVSLEVARSETYFQAFSGKYLLQERFYETVPIRNEIFKKYGGQATVAIQKNIIQLDSLFFYADADWVLSFSKHSAERLVHYGGTIDRQIPVGSFFMPYYFRATSDDRDFKFDILMVGINTCHAWDRMDSYDGFEKDHYDIFRWLVKIKGRFPNLNVAIMHHGSATVDPLEEKIISPSEVVTLDSKLNSYDACFESRVVVTMGSTMGYEMLGHSCPVIFLAPRGLNTFLPDQYDRILCPGVACSYQSFEDAFFEIVDDPSKYIRAFEPLEQYCIESRHNVLERIVQELT